MSKAISNKTTQPGCLPLVANKIKNAPPNIVKEMVLKMVSMKLLLNASCNFEIFNRSIPIKIPKIVAKCQVPHKI